MRDTSMKSKRITLASHTGIVFCSLLVILLGASCSPTRDDPGYREIHVYGDTKVLHLDSERGVEVLKEVLNDWDKVLSSIERFSSYACLAGLTIDSITSVLVYRGMVRAHFVARSLSDVDADALVLGIGLESSPCLEEFPMWVVVKDGNRYEVIDVVVIE
jgi:hypothetical protein